jgi:hypothetical protein
MNKKIAIFLSVLALTSGQAQNNEVNDDQALIVYKIKAGDTFSKFARKYLVQPLDVAAIKKANRLHNLDQLTIGEDLNIPRHLVKQSPSKATVMSLSCATPIRLSNSAKLLIVGSALYEGAIIEIPPECHTSLLLEDGSIARLPSGTALKISTLRKNQLEAAPEVRFDLTKGRIELDVHKGREKTTPFEVRTPLSVMGVRGTEFRVGYSPDEQSGQVEVLGGIVQTRGNRDSAAKPITKGLGVPIDANGKSLAVENLLDAPLFKSVVTTEGSQPSYVIQLSAVPLAMYYIANSSSTANLTGNRMSQHLMAPELFVSKLTKQASFYQLTSVSQTGLVGTERQYAFCVTPTDPQMAKCSALFDAPLADGTPISFALTQHTKDSSRHIVDTKNLQARQGRFAIQGLPIGQYSWTLSYNLANTDATANDTTIRQSGSFELIALPIKAP